MITLTFDDAVDAFDVDEECGPGRDHIDDITCLVRQVLTDNDGNVAETSCPDTSTSEDCDMSATFYINRPRLGHKSSFNLSRLQDIAALGMEVGGHTAHHQNLPRIVGTGETKRQICWDRNQLTTLEADSAGTTTFDIYNVAYPFGKYVLSPPGIANFNVRNIVGRGRTLVPPALACGGYQSARSTGGVASCSNPGTSSCPYAETLPLDAGREWEIRTADSIQGAIHSLTDIKGWIENARDNTAPTGKRWWLILVFHRVCPDTGSLCNRYGIRESDFIDLIEFLREERKDGNIEIKNMHQALHDEDPTTYPNTEYARVETNDTDFPWGYVTAKGNSPGVGFDLVRGFEDDSNTDGIPDCFQASGANLTVSMNTWDPHGGSSSVRLQAAAGSPVKLLLMHDFNACALNATANTSGNDTGYTYTVTFWWRAHQEGMLASAAEDEGSDRPVVRATARGDWEVYDGVASSLYVPPPGWSIEDVAALDVGISDAPPVARALIDPCPITTNCVRPIVYWRSTFSQTWMSTLPDPLNDGFWSSAVGMEYEDTIPTVWTQATAQTTEARPKFRDAISVGVELTPASASSIDIDVDDIDICVNHTGTVNGIKKCQ